MKEILNNLSKEQLVNLAGTLLNLHSDYYESVVKNESDVSSAFFELSGAIGSVKKMHGLNISTKNDG